MKTAVVVFVFVEYISIYVLAISWWQNKGRFSGIGLFCAGFSVIALGMTLALSGDLLPVAISVVVANLMVFFGHVLLLFGFSAFLKIHTNKFIYYIAAILYGLVYGYFTLIEPNVAVRIMLFSAAALIVNISMLYLLCFRAKKDDSHNLSSVAIAIVMQCFVFAIRFIYAVYDYSELAQTNLTYLELSSYEAIFIMATIITTVLFVFSLELMINGRLFKLTEERAAIQKELLAETEKLASTDSLTNLYNRRKIESSIHQEFTRTTRCGGYFSVVLCDLDNFKATNDKYGHDIGDKALVEVANILTDIIGRAGKVGRWGGEEFMVLLPKLSLREAIQVAGSIQTYLDSYQPKYAESEKLTMSFGVADNHFSHKCYQEMVKQADKALYRAKDNGRNRVEYSQMEPVTT
ncbi:GGDEF domain-containing protein [Vibrio sp. SCSIO 43137]|uniref:GGDEF domain-containing protein n=1 Tax=Vibrio sp. SCSIO 43137 TaxID=3021011 RepID=UPI0023074F79|nr:GGDEF domain-containing protein [Vibrio sp. SCSIO 43137]WCE28933.1 GGDEF domain-containing protein [Vibrio sp. SCSIO 43137]